MRTRIYVTDIAVWREVGAAHAEFFAEIRPAAAMVEVSALITPALLVEIEADAISRPIAEIPVTPLSPGIASIQLSDSRAGSRSTWSASGFRSIVVRSRLFGRNATAISVITAAPAATRKIVPVASP